MLKKFHSLAIVAATWAALTGTASAQELIVEELPETEIQFIGTSIGSPPWELVNEYLTKTMPARTQGRVRGKTQSITELGVEGPEAVRMLTRGVAHMMDTAAGFYSGDIPEVDGLDIAGLVPDIKTLRTTVDAYQPVLTEIYKDRLDARLLALWPLAGQVFWCTTPISGLEDLEGKKVRVFTASMADFVESIGAVPTTIAFSEVVPALQRNVIDCAITGSVAGNLANWTEVTSHIYPLVTGWALHATLASDEWFSGRDPVLQEYIAAEMRMMSAIAWQQAVIGTNQGIWCSTGDDRCKPDLIKPKPLSKANLTLVPVSEEDKETAKRLLEDSALAKFAERCGQECAARWNETVGAALGVSATTE